MNPKQFRQLTIIPPNLYVERSADRQLAGIIENMGRPGYVLVARQMGKTNLLLHAKNELSKSGSKFLYIDASNSFPDIRSFFRNVVDTYLETDTTLLPIYRESILRTRAANEKLPHKEHEYELREILRTTERKLVICIDEIDALKKCDYSDEVFSFIRSIYFSGRANFTEFHRITYILSGVAEPAEIIKNKDISPFNIGEKIYLDDFNRKEVKTLLSQASIALDDSVINSLYNWTSGHPRMTWDVISFLEDLQLQKQQITPNSVDQAIRKLYFDDIESAPIDHIKKVCESHADIRDAAIAIHYNKTDKLPEQTKTKLYLLGITRSSTDGSPISFKNRVIEESLSEDFLLSTPRKTFKALLEEAVGHLQSDDKSNALIKFKSALEEATATEEKIEAIIWLGKTYLQLQNPTDCFHLFESTAELKRQDSTSSIVEANILHGISAFREMEDQRCYQIFQEINFNLRDPLHIEGYVDYLDVATNFLNSKLNIEQELVKCRSILSDRSFTQDIRPVTRTASNLIAKLQFVYAKLRQLNNDPTSAVVSTLQERLELANNDLKIRFLLALSDLSQAQRKTLFAQCLSLLTSSKGFSSSREPEFGSISIETLLQLLKRASSAQTKTVLDQILDSILSDDKTGLSPASTISLLAQLALLRNESDVGSKIIAGTFPTIEENLSKKEKRNILRYAINSSTNPSQYLIDQFFDTFSDSEPATPSDLSAIYNIATISANTFRFSNIEACAKLFETAKGSLSTSIEQNSHSIVQDYLRHLAALTTRPNPGEVHLARIFLQRIQNNTSFQLPGFVSNHLPIMISQIVIRLKRFGGAPTKKVGAKFGRNEIVTVSYNESYMTGKFKKFESDIQDGKCKLIGKGSISPETGTRD